MTIAPLPVQAHEITGIDNLDPVRVITTDYAPGQGRIIIECYGNAWSSYWHSMGNKTVRQFFAGADPDYLAERLRTNFHLRDRRQRTYLLRIITAVQQALLAGEEHHTPAGQ